MATDRENQRLRQSTGTLDQDMQELQRMVASTRQEVQVVQSNLAVDRKRLKNTADQLVKARNENEILKKKYDDLVATTQRKGGAIITASSTLGSSMPSVDIPGVSVRAEDDVVRCEIPSDRLFQSNTNQLSEEGAKLLDGVTAQLLSAYPNKIIGIEGHVAGVPGENGSPAVHEASIALAMAVCKHLSSKPSIGFSRLFVTGHGPNCPIYSNGSDEGRRRNNRIELVVYPDTANPI